MTGPVVAFTLSWESVDFLPRWLASTLEWADEVYVLDTGSTDGSRDLLRDFSDIRYSEVDTSAETFNNGRCSNLLLDRIDADGLAPSWLVKVDCDELFEPGFVDISLPVLRTLPRPYNEVSMRRPNTWYGDHQILTGGKKDTFQERPWQRYRPGLRYPEEQFHLSRRLHRRPVTFKSGAYLLHYEFRSVDRSLVQAERLAALGTRHDPAILHRSPDDPPPTTTFEPLAVRGEQVPSRSDAWRQGLEAGLRTVARRRPWRSPRR